MTRAALRLGALYRAELGGEIPGVTLRALILLELARRFCDLLGFEKTRLGESRLANLSGDFACPLECARLVPEYAELVGTDLPLQAARLLGQTLDLLQASETGRERKKTGSYFTPSAVAEDLLGRALRDSTSLDASRPLTVCDPACGGGAFLVEAARLLSERSGARSSICSRIYGTDLSEVALATTEMALWFLAGDDKAPVGDPKRFAVGDALWGASFTRDSVDDESLIGTEGSALRLDFPVRFPDISPRGFDWVVGNPPWVAFQGRATQKISTERRSFYRARYAAFSGYPTLHGLFIQRAAELAPNGCVTLLVPSSVSDLDGYKETRRILRTSHTARVPLPEYGQDAFEGVVQPCFGLIADPGTDGVHPADAVWPLQEKTHAESKMVMTPPPTALRLVESLPLLPRETFGEVGFQSNRIVGTKLFYRGEGPPEQFSVPLLEGRNVAEFVERTPRLFLWPDQETLRQTKCRLKSAESYQAVTLVVRQTAAYTIAARHDGVRFRNSLIGAFETESVGADLLLGLLNSVLFRALHVARQRDARQATFPQVKIAHLRRLPMPPADRGLRESVEEVSRLGSRMGGLDAALRVQLDRAVFDLFSIPASDREPIAEFLASVAPAAVRPSRT